MDALLDVAPLSGLLRQMLDQLDAHGDALGELHRDQQAAEARLREEISAAEARRAAALSAAEERTQTQLGRAEQQLGKTSKHLLEVCEALRGQLKAAVARVDALDAAVGERATAAALAGTEHRVEVLESRAAGLEARTGVLSSRADLERLAADLRAAESRVRVEINEARSALSAAAGETEAALRADLEQGVGDLKQTLADTSALQQNRLKQLEERAMDGLRHGAESAASRFAALEEMIVEHEERLARGDEITAEKAGAADVAALCDDVALLATKEELAGATQRASQEVTNVLQLLEDTRVAQESNRNEMAQLQLRVGGKVSDERLREVDAAIRRSCASQQQLDVALAPLQARLDKFAARVEQLGAGVKGAAQESSVKKLAADLAVLRQAFEMDVSLSVEPAAADVGGEGEGAGAPADADPKADGGGVGARAGTPGSAQLGFDPQPPPGRQQQQRRPGPGRRTSTTSPRQQQAQQQQQQLQAQQQEARAVQQRLAAISPMAGLMYAVGSHAGEAGKKSPIAALAPPPPGASPAAAAITAADAGTLGEAMGQVRQFYEVMQAELEYLHVTLADIKRVMEGAHVHGSADQFSSSALWQQMIAFRKLFILTSTASAGSAPPGADLTPSPVGRGLAKFATPKMQQFKTPMEKRQWSRDEQQRWLVEQRMPSLPGLR